MKPQLGKDLTFVRASYNSIRGPIASHWQRQDNTFHWRITLPPGSSATIYLPTTDVASITESGQRLDQADHLRLLKMEGDRAIMEIESGVYQFDSVVE